MKLGPRAYQLAQKNRNDLNEKYIEVYQNSSNRKEVLLKSLDNMILGGNLAINMSLTRCCRFLESGEWLNIYQSVRKKTGATGKDLMDKVYDLIPDFFDQRRTIEKLLRFRLDTHYASLNLGGPGAIHYGSCCIILDKTRWRPYYTCFPGDTIRACFDSDGKLVLSESNIKQMLSLGDDSNMVGIVKYGPFFDKNRTGFDVRKYINLLEMSNSLIEFHLHGPVETIDVRKVVMDKKIYEHYVNLLERAKTIPGPLPKEFDPVKPFAKLTSLVSKLSIRLELV